MWRTTIRIGVALLTIATARAACAAPATIGAVGDWASLTSGASFGPATGHIDPANPDTYLSGGHVVFADPDVIAGLRAGSSPASIDGLLIRVALGAGATLGSVRVSLTDAQGATQASATLAATSEVTASQAGFGSDPNLTPLTEVLGAFIHLDSSAGVGVGGLLANVRFEFLSMAAGSARVDVFGVGTTGAINGAMTDYAVYDVASGPPVPEPALVGLLLAGAVALAVAHRSRRACPTS